MTAHDPDHHHFQVTVCIFRTYTVCEMIQIVIYYIVVTMYAFSNSARTRGDPSKKNEVDQVAQVAGQIWLLLGQGRPLVSSNS